VVPYGDRSRRSYSRSCNCYGGSLMPVVIPGHPMFNPRGYHEIKQTREVLVPFVIEEAPHIAASVAVNLGARANPYVWIATVLAHAGYHLLSKYLDSGSSSSSYQQNGGPETFSNYKASRNSRTDAARSLFRTGGRRSGSKPRGPKGTLIKCPKGYHWDKKTGRCLRNRKY